MKKTSNIKRVISQKVILHDKPSGKKCFVDIFRYKKK